MIGGITGFFTPGCGSDLFDGLEWAWDHKAQIAGGVAFGACVFGSPALCLLMSRIAIGASSLDRAERSFSQPGGFGSAENWAQWGTGTLIDVGINWAAGGAVRSPVMRGARVSVHAGRVTTMATQSGTAGGSYQGAVRLLRFTRQASWWNLGQLNVL